MLAEEWSDEKTTYSTGDHRLIGDGWFSVGSEFSGNESVC